MYIYTFFFMMNILGYEPSHLGWGGINPASDMRGKTNLFVFGTMFAVTCCLDHKAAHQLIQCIR